MQHINLLEASLLPPAQRLQPALLLALLGTAFTLVLGHYAWERTSLARELASATAPASAADVEPAVSAPDALEGNQLAQREALRDLLRNSLALADGSTELIAEVLQTLPPQVWLTELELGPQRSLRISGGTLDTGAFGLLGAGLTEVAALRGLPLNTVRLTPMPAAAETAEDGPATAPVGHLFVLATAPPGSGSGAGSSPGAGVTGIGPVGVTVGAAR